MKLFTSCVLMSLPFVCIAQIENIKEQATKDSGLHWVTNMTWEQIKKKAKSERKYIFLDCFATWCAPCKKMDKTVYPSADVGEAMNGKFISVKVQMDKTMFDDADVKDWYKDAGELKSSYNVSSFPTFLFFTPDGEAVHKGVGFMNAQQMINLSKDALDPQKQFYKVSKDFRAGQTDLKELKKMIPQFLKVDKPLGLKMGADYFSRIPSSEIDSADNFQLMLLCKESNAVQKVLLTYLNSLEKTERFTNVSLKLTNGFSDNIEVQNLVFRWIQELPKNEWGKNGTLTLLMNLKRNPKAIELANGYFASLPKREVFVKQNLLFLGAFTANPSDKGFSIFWKESQKIDSVLGKGASQKYVDEIISNEIIKADFERYKDSDKEPDWAKLERRIVKTYGKSTALRIIGTKQMQFFQYRKEKHNSNWDECIKYTLAYYDCIETDSTASWRSFNLNNFCYFDVFFHSNDTHQLTIAAHLMSQLVNANPDDDAYADTYANLLYRLGKKSEAIMFEEKALAIAVDSKSGFSVKEYSKTLEKMHADIPTWVK